MKLLRNPKFNLFLHTQDDELMKPTFGNDSDNGKKTGVHNTSEKEVIILFGLLDSQMS